MRWYHDHLYGKGYQDRLSGEDIPEETHIVAVADAYDAMSSNRSYREKLTDEKIMAELNNGKGSQFDPKFADIMIEIMKEKLEQESKENAND